MTDREWVDRYAAILGLEAPDDERVATLLDLAGVAAHASQRRAAPIACWLAARSGLAPEDALRLACRVDETAG